jgi:hypothetical protein
MTDEEYSNWEDDNSWADDPIVESLREEWVRARQDLLDHGLDHTASAGQDGGSSWVDDSSGAKRVYVYIAGPLTSSGDVAMNVRAALEAAEEAARQGFWPYVPHLTLFWHMIYPHHGRHEVSFWMQLDRAWLEQCDALVRLEGESIGADMEVEWAGELSIPVFTKAELFSGYMDAMLPFPEGFRQGG